MKGSYLLILVVVSFLVLSPGELAAQPACSESIHLPNCSHETCVQSCVDKYGESINGACIDDKTCCCKF
ncbi:hypothetical protein V6N12_048005 [Hibiscus sabdariffa]|uniref:Uncharacterized protein n=1 Tax=Hibiscus sabdariffa TaxID=183260 RepID=A0ABR2CWC4_9ROSI